MRFLLLISFLTFFATGFSQDSIFPTSDYTFRWEEIAPLPEAPGSDIQHGLAGAYIGTLGDKLFLAGGANFPYKTPWDGGRKVWWDDIYVLSRDDENQWQWTTRQQWRLPRPMAYGATIANENSLILIGGCDANRAYSDVWQMTYDPDEQKIQYEMLPPLPVPLAFFGATLLNGKIYVAGGQEEMTGATSTHHFFVLNLNQLAGNQEGWESLSTWPGPSRVLPVVVSQAAGDEAFVYLFSGRAVDSTGLIPLTDGYRYNPSTRIWDDLGDILPNDGKPRCVMGAAAITTGARHIMVLGGDRGDQLHLPSPQSHTGFSREILTYHTTTNTWAISGYFPGDCPVTTAVAKLGEDYIIPSGEIRPGIRTDKVFRASPPLTLSFGWVNYLVLGLYLMMLVGMGFYFARREKTTQDYFLAGKRIPWWAAGISLFGTLLSAITFMAVPAKSFETNWLYFVSPLTQLIVAPVIVLLLLPAFHRLNITTAYEYLESRFNLFARLMGSLSFLIFQFGRIAIVLFLPSIALSVVTGINIYLCIVLMASLSIIYTVLGGIEAVVWTDVLQVFVLVGGALISFFVMMSEIDGGFGAFVEIASADAKFKAFDFRADLTIPTFWVVFIGGLGSSFIQQGTDQGSVQRLLATPDQKSASRGLWTSAVMGIPSAIIFFSLGTALYVYFKTHPAELIPTLENTDAIFPWYIVTQLPDGVSGLLIAGIFAAAMSSLDSSMNSSATVITKDIYERFWSGKSDQEYLTFARRVTAAVGIAGMLFALLMATWEIKSLWDEFLKIVGLLAGGLGGLFLLGAISTRAHGRGAVIGFIASGIIQFFLNLYQPIHFLLFTFTGIVICVVLGYLASIVLKPGSKP